MSRQESCTHLQNPPSRSFSVHVTDLAEIISIRRVPLEPQSFPMELIVKAMRVGENPYDLCRAVPFWEPCRRTRPAENYHGIEPVE